MKSSFPEAEEMKLLYNKVFKNNQVNVGVPFQVRVPISFQSLHNPVTNGALARNLSVKTEEDEVCTELTSEKAEAEARQVVEDARREADLMLQEAQMEALRLLEKAESEINEAFNSACDEAREQGYKEGIAQAQDEYESKLNEAEFIRSHAKTEYNEVLESIESDMVDIILDVARKVIGEEIKTNKENLFYLIRKALEKSSNQDEVTLKVSVKDYKFLEEEKEELYKIIPGTEDMTIKKDASMEEGDLLLETAFGSIDAGVNTQLDKIEEEFRIAVGKG